MVEVGAAVVRGAAGRAARGGRWSPLLSIELEGGDDVGRRMEEQIKGGVKEEAEPV